MNWKGRFVKHRIYPSTRLSAGQVYSAIRPKLTKYRFMKFIRFETTGYGIRIQHDYYFAGTNDSGLTWSDPVRKNLKSFFHAYELCENLNCPRRTRLAETE